MLSAFAFHSIFVVSLTCTANLFSSFFMFCFLTSKLERLKGAIQSAQFIILTHRHIGHSSFILVLLCVLCAYVVKLFLLFMNRCFIILLRNICKIQHPGRVRLFRSPGRFHDHLYGYVQQAPFQ